MSDVRIFLQKFENKANCCYKCQKSFIIEKNKKQLRTVSATYIERVHMCTSAFNAKLLLKEDPV